MAHEIDGDASFVGARQPAWHRLGVVLEDVFDAETALKAAKLDWDVQLLPIAVQLPTPGENVGQILTERPQYVTSSDYHATVRQSPHDGTWQILGAGMSSSYRPVQNREAFAFMDEVVGTIGGAHYETAGALRGGRQIFLSVKGESVDLDPEGRRDRIDQYLLGINSHDGSLAFGMLWTPVRVVCANTLGCAVGSGRGKTRQGNRWATRHTRDILNRAEAARTTLNIGFDFMKEWSDEARLMIQKRLTEDRFNAIVKDLFTDEDGDVNDEHVIGVQGVYEASRTVETIRETVWGGLNATTEYLDWYTNVRGGKKTSVDEQRFRRQVNWEAGNDMKQNAWDRFLSECEDAVGASA